MGSPNEQAVVDKGREIFRLMHEARPRIFDRGWWASRILDLAMDNEALKVQIFRFVDVLPALTSPQEVTRHIKEYFLSEGTRFPLAVRTVLSTLVSPLTAPLTALAFRKEVEEISRNFIAGEDLATARGSLRGIWQGGRCFTVDLLGEVAVSESEADTYRSRYLALAEELSAEIDSWEPSGTEGQALPDLSISVKISSLYSRIGPRNHDDSVAQVKERLRPIFRAVKDRGGSVNLDMESYDLHGITFEVFTGLLDEKEFRDWTEAGLAVQAYMKSARDDLGGLVRWARQGKRRVTVRLVKGAYWEHEIMTARQRGRPVPVFEKKSHTDRNFERCTEYLFDNRDVLIPAVASHNVRSLAHAMVCAEQSGAERNDYEFQMLYGMAEPIKEALGTLGYRVREYTPMGALIPGMAYLVRRLLENTSNEGFLRKRFAEQVDKDVLLGAPEAPPTDETDEPGSARCRLAFVNEPLVDFRRSDARQAFAAAVGAVRARLGVFYPFIVGGRERRGTDEIVSVNPADPNTVVGRVATLDAATVDMAVEEAQRAQEEWSRRSSGERAAVLIRAAEIARGRRYELAAWQVFEAGKNWTEADADVCEAIDMLEYYAREMVRRGMPQKLGDQPGEDNRYLYRPRGVGLVIAPWNFPLAISTGMTAASLAAGNAVLYKPSSLTPVNGWFMCELFREAGLPEGVLQYVPGLGARVGDRLVEHPGVNFIVFTGSREVGCRIIERAMEQRAGQQGIKRVIAEMGGKNAIIVDADADLDEAVVAVLQSAFGFQGQKCSACSRVIVLEPVYRRFLDRLVDAAGDIQIGPPEDPTFFFGPVIDGKAKEKIQRYVSLGKEGGKCVLQREVPKGGFYVSPTIFANLSPQARLLREEIFGPVLCVVRAQDLDQAIEAANDSDYALTGGFYSRSPGNIGRVIREFRVGNLYVNRGITGAIVGRQPFGGFKMSGVGFKAGGPDYLLQFLEAQVVTENTARRGFSPELMS